ncbi:tRNA lysidine(34) synthetase TilS [Rouxiella silvae]|uniref:tRNA(Ile)-lysidine synthase n=1 Tax=Rouxiella silvae TaxID=1646373 RepID=A0AA41BVH4_9GAMM|nr:tRNA lysidine(34) synthetase TilS [Rouxiella silvae]MBF6635819.1 tRNA lysidine(34) synthetase TilS [Rouxiella silvae]ORJ20315.1 tRNA lysidine(34) synthetase TilS [Rouxiella silvae]
MLLEHLTQLLGDKSRLCVAFSGGLDSTVLLHALVQLRASSMPHLQLRAVHVNHGLSTHAQRWSDSCRERCGHWQVDFLAISVTVDARAGGVEAAARGARYQALDGNLQEGETLLTAQHLNDQCETFLLALKRGSGPAGLSSMSASTTLGAHALLRPLLYVEREKLEDYARLHQLDWVEDDSNQNSRFDRNFLRLEVLPLLYQRWPHFAAATARSAILCAEQESLLDELLQEGLEQLIDEKGSLSITGLQSLSAPRRFALIRRWLAIQGAKMPSREQLQRIWDEVATSQEDAEPQLRLGENSIRRFRQRLYWLRPMQSLKETVLDWAGDKPLDLPDGLGTLTLDNSAQQGQWVRKPYANETLSVRFHARGYLHIVGRDRSRQIKKLWQELNVPPWERERIPLIFYNEKPIAAAGLFITHEALTQGPQEAHWSLLWKTESE